MPKKQHTLWGGGIISDIDNVILDELCNKWNNKSRSPFIIKDQYQALKNSIIKSIRIIPISKIYPHEETIFENVVKLSTKIRTSKQFTWPIFAEIGTGAILDGMHRWQVMLNFKYIPIQEIEDYNKNRNVKVGVWCRVLKGIGKSDIGLINNILNKCGVSELETIGKLPKDIIKHNEIIDARKNMILIGPNRTCYQFKKSGSLVQEFKDMVKIERFMGKNILGKTKFYKTEHQALNKIGAPNTVVIFPRPISKRDIIRITQRTKMELAQEQPFTQVLPAKSSRHIFQLRIININVPLNNLNSSQTPKQLTEKHQKSLKNRKILYLGKDVNRENRAHYKTLDRQYEEHIFKFG